MSWLAPQSQSRRAIVNGPRLISDRLLCRRCVVVGSWQAKVRVSTTAEAISRPAKFIESSSGHAYPPHDEGGDTMKRTRRSADGTGR
jgi:hypothetical protein